MSQISQRERITQYIRETYGTEAEYLWADSPGSAVFRHPASKKWYAIIMDVPANKLGLSGEDLVDVMNVKCGTIMVGSLLAEKGFRPAYHMNKEHWITVLLDGTVEESKVCGLIDVSFAATASKKKKTL